MEPNQVVLFRYFAVQNELDVFINGKIVCTFSQALYTAPALEELLRNLGYTTFEKQVRDRRWNNQ